MCAPPGQFLSNPSRDHHRGTGNLGLAGAAVGRHLNLVGTVAAIGMRSLKEAVNDGTVAPVPREACDRAAAWRYTSVDSDLATGTVFRRGKIYTDGSIQLREFAR